MKNLILFLCMLPLLFNSCKKDLVEPDPNDEPSDVQSVSEAVIGADGGKLEAEDFILTVPEGAFDTTVTLKLVPIENDPDRSAVQVSSTYQLIGLNCLWSKPLELKIRFEGTLEEESYMAVGFKHYDVELEDSVMVNELFAAVESQGFLSCTVPPLEVPNSSVKFTPEHPILYHPLAFHARLMVRGWSKIITVRSECAEIKYNPGLNFDRSKVEQFAKYLDEAVYFFDIMGLMEKQIFQKDYMIRVNIFNEPARITHPFFFQPQFEPMEGFDASINSPWTKIYKIKIPGSYFENADNNQLRMAAGEGVFWFDNYCYVKDKKNWLHWALNYWVREYFYGSNPEYKEGNDTYAMVMRPFQGINAIIKDDEETSPMGAYDATKRLHGFGMSSLMKYLFDTYNDNFDLLPKIYAEMSDESGLLHPIDVILNSIEDPEYIWWPGFFKEYLTGGIWDVPAEVFLDKINSSDKVLFMDDTDTVRYFDRSYMDLSAGLFQVNLSKDLSEYVLGDEDKMNFKLGPKSLNMNYVKVLVYKFKEGQLTFLGEGQDVTIDNVKGLIDDGYTTLLAAVVNSANEYPYKEEMNIELTIRMIKEKIWPWKYVTIDAHVTEAIFQSPSMGETSWDNFTHELTDRLLEASEDGTQFTANWLDQDTNYKYEGGIDITVDTETFEITGFYAWSNMESISDNKVTLSEKHDIQGKEGLSIPVVYWDDDYLTHQVSGEEVCSVIGDWTYVYSANPGESYELRNTLATYSCNNNANLLFFWAREKDK